MGADLKLFDGSGGGERNGRILKTGDELLLFIPTPQLISIVSNVIQCTL